MLQLMFSLVSVHTAFQLGLLTLNTPIGTLGAFTLPIRSGNDTIEQNVLDTWCFYPSSNSTQTLDLACSGGTSPKKGDFQAVMEAHLSQRPSDSLSIAYYSASLERLGGAEYPVELSGGKVYLCVSGQKEDSKYLTMCEYAERDNEFGIWNEDESLRRNKTVCAVEVGQRNVSDGCYVPVGRTLAGASSGAVSNPHIRSMLQSISIALVFLLGWLSLSGWLY